MGKLMGERIVKVRELTCERCGHRWTPHQDEVRICPKCKSAWWDTPRGDRR